MKTKSTLVAAGIVAWAGCASPPQEADAPPRDVRQTVATTESCEPPTHALSGDASLVGMSGDYTLTMVVDSDDGRSASGRLTLTDQVEGLGTWQQVTTPLYGSSDIGLDGVGAAEVGEVESADPQEPGVLVMEDRGPDAGARIRLRLGSRANTRDVASFDGGYTILTVTELTEDGFAGGWRSAAGGPPTDGWFCVRRVGAPPA